MDANTFLSATAAEVIDALKTADDLLAEDLDALQAAEQGGQSRKTVLAAIATAITEFASGREQSAKASSVAPPDWQRPDYTGPITATQALWRRTNIVTK